MEKTTWEWAHLKCLNIDQSQFIMVGTDLDWKTIAVSNVTVAALKNDNTLWVWGVNTGNGTSDISNIPVQIGSNDWASVNLGLLPFKGAIKQDGTLWMWGTNTEDLSPVEIGEGVKWTNFYGAGAFYGAVDSENSLYVWGENYIGEIGFGLEGNVIANPTKVTTCSATASLNDNAFTELSVYPNPTSGILNLANADTLNIENITITDMSGKTVFNQKANATQIDVQHLPQGMYFLSITTDAGNTNLKFIKE